MRPALFAVYLTSVLLSGCGGDGGAKPSKTDIENAEMNEVGQLYQLFTLEVLAYEKQVPDSGGNVLMLDRSVKKMTADEFKSAKKAGK